MSHWQIVPFVSASCWPFWSVISVHNINLFPVREPKETTTMRRNPLAQSIILIVLVLLLFVQSACKAQNHYDRAVSSASYNLSPGGITQVSASVYKYYYVNLGVTSVWGTMKVYNSMVYATANAESADFSWVSLLGVTVEHTVLKSKSFSYYDRVSYMSYPAHMVITLTQIGSYGRGSFEITRDSDGTVVAQSLLNGVQAEVPFSTGSVVITE